MRARRDSLGFGLGAAPLRAGAAAAAAAAGARAAGRAGRCVCAAARPGGGGRAGAPARAAGGRARESLASLHELTERIADLLHVGSLTEYGGKDLLCPRDAPMHTPMEEALKHQVVVVFGKRLCGDLLSVEYAKRVVTLVRQIACGAVRPGTVCFTGGRAAGAAADGAAARGEVSEAAAGYLFFRGLCGEVGVDASRFEYILEEESGNTRENLANVLSELRARLGADAVPGCHFTLVSSDYHLTRIQEVHRTCPRRSLLFALDVASASWACIFSAYPFSVSPDPATAFLGRAIVLANDLAIVLVNVSGVVADRALFARENLARLDATAAKMREMFRVVDPTRAVAPHGGFRADMRAHSEVLEHAIHRVREVQTLLAPLADPCASVPRPALERAEALLAAAAAAIRDRLDPDRPLRVADHVDILHDLSAFVAKNAVHPHAGAAPAGADAAPLTAADMHRFARAGAGRAGAGAAAPPERTRTAWPPPARTGGDCLPARHYGDVLPPRAAPVAATAAAGVRVMHKRIARDGPHLILVDAPEPAAAAAAPPPARPAPRPRAKRARAAAAPGELELAAPRKAPRRRRAAVAKPAAPARTTTILGGAKRKAPAKRAPTAADGKPKAVRASKPKASAV